MGLLGGEMKGKEADYIVTLGAKGAATICQEVAVFFLFFLLFLFSSWSTFMCVFVFFLGQLSCVCVWCGMCVWGVVGVGVEVGGVDK